MNCNQLYSINYSTTEQKERKTLKNSKSILLREGRKIIYRVLSVYIFVFWRSISRSFFQFNLLIMDTRTFLMCSVFGVGFG